MAAPPTPDQLRALHAKLCGGGTTRPRSNTTPGAATPPPAKRIVRDRTIWGQVTVFITAAAPVSAMEPGLLRDMCLFLIAAGVAVTIWDRIRDLKGQ